MSDYKKTLNLPATAFPMRADLAKREPETLAFWEKTGAYAAMVAANADHERYVLHDGPPYANGHIHMGTALNKVIKDIIVKSKNLRGLKAEYVPGWDCHGLPIEHKVAQELKAKGKTGLPAVTVRKICRDYAAKWLDVQRKEFKRLGVFGTWDDPYMTMKPAYEAATARELARFMEKGSVRRDKKPIHWCMSCKTALAEAEVEYEDHTSPSVYVRFPLRDPRLAEIFPGVDPARAWVAIWTTTPWTLPANLAVAVHPEFEYACVLADGDYYLLAKELLAVCAVKFGWKSLDILGTVPGAALEGLVARHPFYDRDSKVVLGDYVTLDAGTGCVHTAPGHGREDYDTGLRYGLEILSPLDDDGVFLPSVEYFAGKNVFDANPEIVMLLEDRGNLLAREMITHSYPHCWRCKQPVIFRATTQWFISMSAGQLRHKALEAIENRVQWIPAWGRERIYGMIEGRPDWCISRQRTWGVPIVALLCKDCDDAWFEPSWVHSIVDRFAAHERGCDYWFEAPLSEVVPAGLTCPRCGGSNWEKEDDILDVWFDSGTSYAAVCEQRPECRYPADLYLEGSDQHRGWFHSSLLASVGVRGIPPYKAVLTHGYVVDGEGKKMSKSVGNVIAPEEIIAKFGADVLRMWVSAENYQDDVRISDEILSRLVDAYRRIRNTLRFILGNVGDFDPARDAVAPADMLPLDRYALDLAARLHAKVVRAYDRFEFHKVFYALHTFCINELSAFYLDIVKDRLYVEDQAGLPRRSAQTALWGTLMLLVRDLAPILSFTAEEVFGHLPEGMRQGAGTVFALRFDPPADWTLSEDERHRWDTVLKVRAEVTRAVEPLRKSGAVGHSLDTALTLYCGETLHGLLAGLDLREVFIASRVELAPLEAAPAEALAAAEVQELRIGAAKAPGAKCQRCWIYSEELGTLEGHPDICPRCSGVVRALETGAA